MFRSTETSQKEFEGIARTGYGFDGEASIKDADFEAVRGQFGENEFVKLVKAVNIAHIRQADELIAKLKKI
jgi:hypothetical protein